jgi:hypothetical protein
VFARSRFSIHPTGAVSINTSEDWYLMKNLLNNLYVHDGDLLFNHHPTSPPAPLYWILDPDPPHYTKFEFMPEAQDRLEALPDGFPPILPGVGETSTAIVPRLAVLGQSSSPDQYTTTDLVIGEEDAGQRGARQDPMRTTSVDPRIVFSGLVGPQEFIQYYPLSTRLEWAVLTGSVRGRGHLAAFISSFAHNRMVGHYQLMFRPIDVSTTDFIIRTNDFAVNC